jgi:hypothetical protein
MTQSWGLPKPVRNPYVCEHCGATGTQVLLRDYEHESPNWASFVDKERVRVWLTLSATGPPRASR